MDKKRIFIAIHYLEIGGAETSLIGLLNALDYDKYDVDLFVYSHQGELMEMIPNHVHLIPEIAEYAQIERPLKDVVKDGFFKIVYARLIAKWKYKRYFDRNKPIDRSGIFQYVDNEVVKYLPSLRCLDQYDLAISFVTPHAIVLKKVDAKKKIAWIHTDYSHIDIDIATELPIWNGYDHIVSISADVTKAFISRFPTLDNRIVEIKNILSPDFVRSRANMIPEEIIRKEMPQEEKCVNILSVGRFCHAKNYDNVPIICKLINQILQCEKITVRWYLIGFGSDESIIREKIAEEHAEREVIILGKKSNPYPYIKASDIYVQPSRYEGNSVTVREAQMLCKPVVVTNYATAGSQINAGLDGIIVPLENEGCAKGIASLILDKEKQRELVAYAQTHDFGNTEEAKKIDHLV